MAARERYKSAEEADCRGLCSREGTLFLGQKGQMFKNILKKELVLSPIPNLAVKLFIIAKISIILLQSRN